MARKSKASPESESQSREIVWEGSEDLKPLLVPIGSISVDPANVRRHPERNLEAIRASLMRFGQQKPIVCDSRGIVRAGNGTLEAARSLGWTRIARVATALEGSEATAYSIADNRSGDLATWDVESLVTQLQSLEHDGIEPGSLGFTNDDVAEMFASAEEEAEKDEVRERAAVQLRPLSVKPPPSTVWVLIGIRLADYGRIDAKVKEIACISGVLCETVTNDGFEKEDR